MEPPLKPPLFLIRGSCHCSVDRVDVFQLVPHQVVMLLLSLAAGHETLPVSDGGPNTGSLDFF